MASASQRVQQAVWPWRAPTAARRPNQGVALLRAVLPAAVAGLLWWSGRPLAASVAACLAAALLVLALAAPALHARVEAALQHFGLIVASVVTWLLLTPVWWLCFVPGRLLFQLAGKDPLQRTRQPGQPSYWIARQPPSKPDHWQRQF